MRILILTQYFPPETGAPQNRLYSLATDLIEAGADVIVLTAMPNYPKMEIYKGYKGKIYKKELLNKIIIIRTWIFVVKSKRVLPRLINYTSFVISSMVVGILKVRKPAVIICESPPLFLGLSAIVLKKIKGARLVFNVSDLWPESAEKLNIVTNKQMLGISYWLEKKIYQVSALVSGQTQGIIKNIQARYPMVPVYWFKNGIDTSTFNLNADGSLFRLQNNVGENDFVLLYAGIIGHAQGLEVIIKAARILKDIKEIIFFIVGDGPEKDQLVKLSYEYDLGNIRFISNMPRNKMPEIVAACDAYIVPLKKNDLFKGAIPSKLFEPLAMGKPILLGVDGEAKKIFIEDGNCGIAFEPENEIQLAKGIQLVLDDKTLLSELGANGKKYILQNFDRKVINQDFYKRIKLI
jgi:glycosyltransferase involved in cell wall biosynthesis